MLFCWGNYINVVYVLKCMCMYLSVIVENIYRAVGVHLADICIKFGKSKLHDSIYTLRNIHFSSGIAINASMDHSAPLRVGNCNFDSVSDFYGKLATNLNHHSIAKAIINYQCA